MVAPRRFLPPIGTLLALEAFDRLGTAVAAADELSLTHSAVSRQLKALEGQLGVSMFVRDGKGLALTKAGQRYAVSVREVLRSLAKASLEIKASGNRDSLNLAVLPTFAAVWLTPRLKVFCQRHPDILIHQRARLSPFDLDLENFDAALYFGVMDWPGVHYLELAPERMIPVCAAAEAPARHPDPAALMAARLLHLDSRPGAWEAWFSAKGTTATGLRGMMFDQQATLAAAAAQGLGVALLPEYLAKAEVAAGRLALLDSVGVRTAGSYYLVWPTTAPPSAVLLSLIEHLAEGLAAE